MESPAAPAPHILVAFNAPSLSKFGPRVTTNGVIIYDSSVATPPDLPGVRLVGVPLTAMANTMGRLVLKNMIALGAMAAATKLFPPDTFLTAIRQALQNKPDLLRLNEEAFALGLGALREL